MNRLPPLVASALLILPLLAAAQATPASAPGAAASAPLASKTADGRDFAGLTEKAVKELPRSEKERCYAWLEDADNKRLKHVREEGAQLDAAIAAQRTLTRVRSTFKANGRLTEAEKVDAREALKNPRLPQDLRINMQTALGL